MTYTYRLLPDGSGYVDAEGVHRGAPPTEDDFLRIITNMMHRTLFAQHFLADDSTNNAVYSLEEVDGMLRRGEISNTKAEELLHMSYDTREKGEDKK